MNSLELANAYFDAWNAHDAQAIRAVINESGSYEDPATKAPLVGEAIGKYAQSLWEAFPDLSFELRSIAETGPGKIIAEWTMRGTNAGSFSGLPPTGKAVVLQGVDVIETAEDGIDSVVGYFDSRRVPEQLGLQIIVQPHAAGPFSFGASVAVQTGKKIRPGAFSVTTIWNDTEEDEEIRALSRDTASEMLEMEGFIGLTLMRIGGRGITISAWEKPENTRQLVESPAHRAAMKRFWDSLGWAAFTSVWSPERINPFWVRCKACGKMSDYDAASGQCGCGEALPEAPAWY